MTGSVMNAERHFSMPKQDGAPCVSSSKSVWSCVSPGSKRGFEMWCERCQHHQHRITYVCPSCNKRYCYACWMNFPFSCWEQICCEDCLFGTSQELPIAWQE